MKNLLPHFIQKQYLQSNFQGNFFALTMFVDISGFTAMTESLMKNGAEGAEILSSVLNKVYNPISQAIYKRGGFISTFAGDAFTVIYPQYDVEIREYNRLYTIFSAQKIRRAFKKRGVQKTKFGDFNLEVKIGLSCGNIEWGIVGEDKKMYYFRGEGIDGCVTAESHAKKNQVIFDDKLLSFIQPNNLLFDIVEEGFYRSKMTFLEELPIERRKNLMHIKEPDSEKHKRKRRSPIKKKVAAKFLPQSVIEFKETGEFRNAVSVFISYSGITQKEDLDKFSSILIRNGQRFSGYFNKMDFGDKGNIVLFIFGAPVSFENNIDRALDFILAVKKEAAIIPNITMRAGVTYGTVYAGIIGSSQRCEYTIIGDVVNLSARMMVKAPLDEIWVSEAISNYGSDRFLFEPIGDYKFKGKSINVPVAKLIKEKEIQERLFDTKLIGRKTELDQLNEIAASIFNGHFSGIAYIYGEAGIGKSHLAYTFREMLSQHREFSWYDCPADQILHQPFHPFIRFIRNYFEQSTESDGDENKRRFESIYDNLVAKLNELSAPNSVYIKNEIIRTKSVLGALVGLFWMDSLYEKLDAKGRYENTLTALKNFLLAQSLFKPVIIYLEDGSWIDGDSLSFLEVLTRNIKQYPILILSACRYDDDGKKTNFGLDDVPSFDIELKYLTRQNLKLMTETLLGGQIDDFLLQLLFEKTRANPFYVQQFIYYFKENNLLKLKDGFWSLKTMAVELPDTINTILISRIDRLTRQVREVVKAAAVIGREFEIRVLSLVIKNDVSRQIYMAEKEQIWAIISELQCIFKHGLLRDSAYKMQLKSTRKKLHQFTAEAIEHLYRENLSEKYVDLAFHYEKAEVVTKALYYLKKAGNQAKDSYQNEQALNFYDRYLSILPTAKLSERERINKIIDVSLQKGLISRIVGKWAEAEEMLREAAKLALQIDAQNAYAEINDQLGWLLYLKSEYDEAMACFELELKYSQITNYKKEIARAFGNIGTVYWAKGDYDSAMDYYKKNLDYSQSIDDRKGVSRALGNLGLVHEYKGDYDTAMDCYGKRLEIDKKMEDKVNLQIVLGNIGVIYYNKGNFDEAMNFFLKNLELSEELGDKKITSSAIGNLGAIYAEKGQFDHAMEYFNRKLKLAQELGDNGEAAMSILNIGHVYKDIGKYDNAMNSFRKAYEIFSGLSDKWGTSMVLVEMGDILMYNSDNEESMRCYNEAILMAQDLGMKYFLADYLLRKAQLTIKLKRVNTAKRETDEGLKLAEEIGAREFVFKGKLLKVRLCLLLNSRTEAVEMLKEMLSIYTQALEIAKLYYELWKITNEDNYRKNALSQFKELYKQVPKFEYQNIIAELQS